MKLLRRHPALAGLAIVVVTIVVFALVGTLSNRQSVHTESVAQRVASAPTSGAGASLDGVQLGGADGAKSRADETASTHAGGEKKSAADERRLVRTGTLVLRVDNGKLLAAVEQVTAGAAKNGGYVISSTVGRFDVSSPVSTATAPNETSVPEAADGVPAPTAPPITDGSGGAPTSAWITLRVPRRSFDSAVRQLSQLGKVESVQTSSDDVSEAYADLGAQLRHQRAVERRLLRFLAKTTTIREMLTVQDRIDAVQLKIEQLQAQLKNMNTTTTYATISVSLTEKRAPQSAEIDGTDTFAGVFMNSLRAIGRGAHLSALALTAAIPFLLLIAVLAVVVWLATRQLLRRRRRLAAQRSTQAA